MTWALCSPPLRGFSGWPEVGTAKNRSLKIEGVVATRSDGSLFPRGMPSPSHHSQQGRGLAPSQGERGQPRVKHQTGMISTSMCISIEWRAPNKGCPQRQVKGMVAGEEACGLDRRSLTQLGNCAQADTEDLIAL